MGLEFQLGGSRLDMQSSCLIPGGGGGEDWGLVACKREIRLSGCASVVLVVCVRKRFA